jgi:hypothetical protein
VECVGVVNSLFTVPAVGSTRDPEPTLRTLAIVAVELRRDVEGENEGAEAIDILEARREERLVDKKSKVSSCVIGEGPGTGGRGNEGGKEGGGLGDGMDPLMGRRGDGGM